MSKVKIELSAASFEELRATLTATGHIPDRSRANALKLGPVEIHRVHHAPPAVGDSGQARVHNLGWVSATIVAIEDDKIRVRVAGSETYQDIGMPFYADEWRP